MSERRPITIVAADWPLVADVDRHDGAVECQANHEWAIRVREHADGRRIVYGWLRAGDGGVYAGWRGASGGFLISAVSGEPDDAETIRAIRRVGGIIEDSRMADECISDLPAEDDSDRVRTPVTGEHVETLSTIVALLALIDRALPHVTEPLRSEIRETVRALNVHGEGRAA